MARARARLWLILHASGFVQTKDVEQARNANGVIAGTISLTRTVDASFVDPKSIAKLTAKSVAMATATNDRTNPRIRGEEMWTNLRLLSVQLLHRPLPHRHQL